MAADTKVQDSKKKEGAPVFELFYTQTEFEQWFKNVYNVKKLPMVLVVSASWCPPCNKVKPLLEELFQMYKNKILFCKLYPAEDKGSSLDIPKVLTLLDANQKEDVKFPTVLFFDGKQKECFRTVGGRDLKYYQDKVEKYCL